MLDWKALQPFLPDTLGTLPAVDPVSGQNTNMGPMNVSMVRRSYGVKKSAKVAGTRARVQIIDTAQAPMMRAMVGMGSKMKGDAESVSETTKVGGHPALLRWHRPTMTGKMSLLVGGRFLINMGVRPIKGIAEGKSLLAKLDIAKLATLAASKAKEAAAAKKKAATK
ncbi:MAG: hypothetical protein KC503_32920 [Myxococcales bacterium]|nr:hypothetical protein [Myxococcales bacterium]